MIPFLNTVIFILLRSRFFMPIFLCILYILLFSKNLEFHRQYFYVGYLLKVTVVIDIRKLIIGMASLLARSQTKTKYSITP